MKKDRKSSFVREAGNREQRADAAVYPCELYPIVQDDNQTIAAAMDKVRQVRRFGREGNVQGDAPF